MSINVWQYQGAVITSTPNGANGCGQPNVLFESGAVILSGTVFKMWFTQNSGTKPGLYYAESSDGVNFTQYPTNPVLALTGQTFSRVWKDGSTYFAAPKNLGTNNIDIYTSPDGITWTLAKSDAIVSGGAGAWDTIVWQLNLLDVVGGVRYGYYTGIKNTTPPTAWAMGLATSPDGLTWTKSPANPIITAFGPSNFCWSKISGRYYGWSQIVLPQFLAGSTLSGCPSDIMRFVGSNPSGPFTALGTPTLCRAYINEGSSQPLGQIADPAIVSDGTSIYFYYTTTNTSASGTYQIACVKAPNMTYAQLVATLEGNFDAPFPFSLPNEFTSLVTYDPSTQPDTNPIGGLWSPRVAGSVAQIVSGQIKGTTAGQNDDSYYNGISWPNDQWASVVVKTCLGNSFVGVALRQNTAGVNTCYKFHWSGVLGSPGAWTIRRLVAGVQTNLRGNGLGGDTTLTLNANDVILGTAIGNVISYYINGALIASIQDSNIASGAAGFAIAPITAVGNAALGAFAGGGVQQAFPPVPGGSGVAPNFRFMF